MANKKNYHYVLVFTTDGPVYVTSVNNANHWANWEKDKVPQDFPKYYAEELVMGLNLNLCHAVLVTSKYKLLQPYNYDTHACIFTPKS